MAFVYQRYSDNMALAGTAAATASADSAYPATNLNDGDPSNPAKLTVTSGSWRIDLGASFTYGVDIAAIINHNLTAGLAVKVKANATGVITDPLDVDQSITIPAAREDGLSTNAALDVSGLGAARVQRYWWIHVTGTNAANLAIGEVLLLKGKRTLDPVWAPVERVDEHPVVTIETDARVRMIYDMGSVVRRFEADLAMFGTTARDAFVGHVRDSRGTARSFLVWPETAVNDAMLMRYSGDPVLHQNKNEPLVWRAHLSLIEVGSGVAL